MRNLCILFLILAVPYTAKASIKIVAPDYSVSGQVSNIAVDFVDEKVFFSHVLVFEGEISVDISSATLMEYPGQRVLEDHTGDAVFESYLANFGITDPVSIVYYELVDITCAAPTISGRSVDNILMTDLGCGIATITLVSGANEEIIDRVEIPLSVPEPATVTLLALGGFFLRRRR